MLRIILTATMVFMFLFSRPTPVSINPKAAMTSTRCSTTSFLTMTSVIPVLSSDIELLNSSYFIPDGEDTQWASAGDMLKIDATYRDAMFWQELGYISGDAYVSLIDRQDINNRQYTRQEADGFTIPENFTWTDTIGLTGDDPLQRWYSETEMNSLGGKDHFLAFAIDDENLLSVFNDRFGTDYHAGIDDVWMIAFEDLNLGDADYTDLVAVIARPADLNPVPLPASGLLLAGAVGAMGCLRRRQTKPFYRRYAE